MRNGWAYRQSVWGRPVGRTSNKKVIRCTRRTGDAQVAMQGATMMPGRLNNKWQQNWLVRSSCARAMRSAIKCKKRIAPHCTSATQPGRWEGWRHYLIGSQPYRPPPGNGFAGIRRLQSIYLIELTGLRIVVLTMRSTNFAPNWPHTGHTGQREHAVRFR